MTTHATVDKDVLRTEVQKKYAEVATNPDQKFHFHSGRKLVEMLAYP